MLAGNIFIDVIHWSRTIEGDHDIDVMNSVRFEFYECTSHTIAIELESTFSFSASKHGKSFLVIHRDFIYIYFLTFNFFYTSDSICNDREISYAKEIKF